MALWQQDLLIGENAVFAQLVEATKVVSLKQGGIQESCSQVVSSK